MSHSSPSSSSSSSSPDCNRQHTRSRILVEVRWHNRQEEAVAAELCDVSAEGAFLVPAGPLPEGVAPGDPVWVSVPTTAGVATLAGTVRWRGFHPGHEAVGVGIKLDAQSATAIATVFPILRKAANE